MHEMEGPRRSCCPAVIDRSTSTGLAGLLRVVPAPIARDRHGVERVAPRGPPVPIARVQLLRGAGASRGPLVPIARVQLLREAASRGPPVPIARVQLLREARSSRSSGPDRSSPAPSRSGAPPTPPRSLEIRLHGTAPPRRALIAQDMSSWDGCPWCDLAIARPSTPRNPPPLLENPLLTVVSHCLPASRKFPSESVPVPGDKEMSSGPDATPTRAFPQGFPTTFPVHRTVHSRAPVVPRKPRVVHRVIHRMHPQARRHLSSIRTPSGPAAAGRSAPDAPSTGASASEGSSVVEVGAVPAAAAAAGAAVGEEAGGQDEQAADRVEVARVPGGQRGRVRREQLGAPGRVRRQPGRVRLGQGARRQRVGHRASVGGMTQWTAMSTAAMRRPTAAPATLAACAALAILLALTGCSSGSDAAPRSAASGSPDASTSRPRLADRRPGRADRLGPDRGRAGPGPRHGGGDDAGRAGQHRADAGLLGLRRRSSPPRPRRSATS